MPRRVKSEEVEPEWMKEGREYAEKLARDKIAKSQKEIDRQLNQK